MNKLRKKQIKVAATAFIALAGGLTIWSCSQDELDDFGQPIYHYTAEEIATLRSLAEDYGVPNIQFQSQSETPLLPFKEMEKTIKTMGAINSLSQWPMTEEFDSVQNTIVFKSRNLPYARLPQLNIEQSTKDYIFDGFISEIGTGAYMYLKVSITTTTAIDGSLNPYPIPQVTITAKLELPTDYQAHGYGIKDEKTTYYWEHDKLLDVTYTCTIYRSDYTVEQYFTFHKDVHIQ